MKTVRDWQIRETVAAILMLLVGLAIITKCTGCAPVQAKALTSVQVAEWALPYRHELEVCIAQVKEKGLPKADRFDAYVDCEEVATRKTCDRASASQRAAWKQCQEVSK